MLGPFHGLYPYTLLMKGRYNVLSARCPSIRVAGPGNPYLLRVDELNETPGLGLRASTDAWVTRVNLR